MPKVERPRRHRSHLILDRLEGRISVWPPRRARPRPPGEPGPSLRLRATVGGMSPVIVGRTREESAAAEPVPNCERSRQPVTIRIFTDAAMPVME